MSEIVENTKEKFEFYDRHNCNYLMCRLEGKQLHLDGVTLNVNQLRKLITWLERADRVMSGIGE